ncbi:MAG: SH3 domain-containing protein [Verrucomicrobiales bacterium]
MKNFYQKYWATLGCLLVGLGGVYAETPFEQGVTAYEEEKYREATGFFLQDLKENGPDALTETFLGNAYFRMNEGGRAALHYERALLIDPSYSLAQSNLQLIRSKLGSQVAEPYWQERLFQALSPRWMWVMLCLGFWSTSFALGRWAFGHRRFRWVLLISGLLLISASTIPLLAQSQLNAREFAVILPNSSPARHAPALSARTMTGLAAGSRVEIIAERGSWSFVRTPSGREGWLPTGHLAVIQLELQEDSRPPPAEGV